MEGALTRQELYDLVWAEPVRTVAQRFGISDIALRKHCATAAAPVPPCQPWASYDVQIGRSSTRF
jgi:hypothetical protein